MVDLQNSTLVESQLVDERSDIIRDELEKEYLVALKEDIAEWINELLSLDIAPDSLITVLEDGILLNQLAQYIHQVGDSYFDTHTGLSRKAKKLPAKYPKYRQNASSNAFFARDNVSNFITWCKQLGVPEVIMFETEDLVSQKNIKSVLICLLEISRIAVKYGVAPTAIVALENEMDKDQGRSDCSDDSCETSSVVSYATTGSQTDLAFDDKRASDNRDDKLLIARKGSSTSHKRTKQKSLIPVKGLKKQNDEIIDHPEEPINIDDKIQDLLSKCSCKRKFTLRKLSEGKYRVGEDGPIIFIRVLRRHVMVRVGGGWDTLRNYMNKHDPCLYYGSGETNAKAKDKKRSPALTPSHSIGSINSPSNRQKSFQTTLMDNNSSISTTFDESNRSISAKSSPKLHRQRQRSSSFTTSGTNTDVSFSQNVLEDLTAIDPSSHKILQFSSPVSRIPKVRNDKKGESIKSETVTRPANARRRSSNIPLKSQKMP